MKQYAPGKEPQYDREDDKLHAEEIEFKGGILEKIDNFWFYHKWKVIAVVAAVFLVFIMCIQMCGNVADDVTLMYAGSSYLTTVPNYEEILAKFEEVMPYDFDGDGTIIGCRDASQLINVTRELLRRGYDEAIIADIWGRNWLRVMAEVQKNALQEP